MHLQAGLDGRGRHLVGAWLSVCVILAAGTASSLGIDVVAVSSTGRSTTELEAGDILTVDLRLRNESRIDLYGIEIVAFGHDVNRRGIFSGGLRWVDGERASSAFNEARVGDTAFGGLSAAPGPSERHNYFGFVNPDPRMPNGNLVVAFGGIGLSPSSGSGLEDIGVDGRPISEGDVHIRLRYEAVPTPEQVTLDLVFGIPDPDVSFWVDDHGYIALGADLRPLRFENDSWEVTVLASDLPISNPEPTTGVLIGMGLVGLSWQTRVRTQVER